MVSKILKKIANKYTIVVADFKTVEKKFINQGASPAEVKNYLSKFKTLKDRNILQGEDRDIDVVGKKPWDDFKNFVDLASEQKSKTEMKHIARNEGAKLVFEDDNWQVYHILSYEASKLYGSGTKWCISSNETDENWKSYNKKSHFYFLISKTQTKENPFYKIAVQVDVEGRKTAWDALDIKHRLPDLRLSKLPDFEYQVPKEAVVIKGLRREIWELQQQVKNNSEQIKALLREHGFKEFIDDCLVVETWASVQAYASDESSDLSDLIDRIEEGDLVDVDLNDDEQIEYLFDAVSEKKEFAKIIADIAKSNDLSAYAEYEDLDIEEVQKEFKENPKKLISEMLFSNASMTKTDELKSALVSAIMDGWNAGTANKEWEMIKSFFTSPPNDYYKFILSKPYWIDGPIKLVLPLLYIVEELDDIMTAEGDLSDLFERPTFKSDNHRDIEIDFDREYAIDSFFDRI